MQETIERCNSIFYINMLMLATRFLTSVHKAAQKSKKTLYLSNSSYY